MYRKLAAFVAAAATAGTGGHADAEDKVFLGNLHSHRSYSDGTGKPGEAYDHARNAGLDFMALIEHNHAEAVGSDQTGIALNHDLYNGTDENSLISIAKAKTVDGGSSRCTARDTRPSTRATT